MPVLRLNLPRIAPLSLALAAVLALALLPGTAASRVTVDLGLTLPTTRLLGAAGASDFGQALVAADVNGDTIADLIVADPPRSGGGAPMASEAGRVYVFFGGPTFFSQPFRLSSVANVVITSSIRSVPVSANGIPAAGDVNADGIADIVIGSTTARLGCATDCGGTWVVLGRSVWPATVDVSTQALWTFRGTGLRFGIATVEDIDDDGLGDVLIRQPEHSSMNGASSGRVLAYLSRRLSAGQFVDTAVTAADLETLGAAASARHVGIRAADLDDFGTREIAFTSGALATARAIGTGADLPAARVVDLADTTSLAVLEDPVVSNRTIFGGREQLDGRGLADELTSSSAASSLGRMANGVVGVRLSAPPLALGEQREMGPAVADWRAHGPVDNALVSASIVDDFTGDGVADLLVATSLSLALPVPRVLIMPVSAPCPGAITDVDLATATDVLAIIPGAAGDFFGSSIAVADFDGDGLADIAIGVPDGDGTVFGDGLGHVAIERGRADWDGDGLAGGADCAPFDAVAGTRAMQPLLMVRKGPAAAAALAWTAPGAGATSAVLSTSIANLHADRGFVRASVLARDLAATAHSDARAVPAPGDGWAYLIVGRNACGFTLSSDGSAAADLDQRLCTLLP